MRVSDVFFFVFCSDDIFVVVSVSVRVGMAVSVSVCVRCVAVSVSDVFLCFCFFCFFFFYRFCCFLLSFCKTIFSALRAIRFCFVAVFVSVVIVLGRFCAQKICCASREM